MDVKDIAARGDHFEPSTALELRRNLSNLSSHLQAMAVDLHDISGVASLGTLSPNDLDQLVASLDGIFNMEGLERSVERIRSLAQRLREEGQIYEY